MELASVSVAGGVSIVHRAYLSTPMAHLGLADPQ